MKQFILFLTLIASAFSSTAQTKTNLTPEQLWKFGRVTGLGISKDNGHIVYSVSTPNMDANKSTRKTYYVSVTGGESIEVTNTDSILGDPKISSNKKFYSFSNGVKITKTRGAIQRPFKIKCLYLQFTQLPALGYMGRRAIRSYFYCTNGKWCTR